MNSPDKEYSMSRESKMSDIEQAIRRALQRRDRGCRFSGCTAHKYVDAHHIVHWADGGETKMDNLVLLCRHHHRLVHEGGFDVRMTANGPEFTDATGRAIPAVAETRSRGNVFVLKLQNRKRGLALGAETTIPMGRRANGRWNGGRRVVAVRIARRPCLSTIVSAGAIESVMMCRSKLSGASYRGYAACRGLIRSISFLPDSAASHRSIARCAFIQNSGELPKSRPSRNAISGLTARRWTPAHQSPRINPCARAPSAC
ncbi:MAG: HNH endonuclease [Wenzhouxiangellaceae bacterium]|nr:HNH endonuclease [Wenzhouxiangellaceae bacterium]